MLLTVSEFASLKRGGLKGEHVHFIENTGAALMYDDIDKYIEHINRDGEFFHSVEEEEAFIDSMRGLPAQKAGDYLNTEFKGILDVDCALKMSGICKHFGVKL